MKGDRKNKVFSLLEECPEEYSGTLPNRFINIKNQTYGNLKVLYLTGFRNKRAEWLCQCLACGSYVVINSHNIRSGHTKSCGCLISKNLRQDLTGNTYGYLKVLKYDCSKDETPFWIVRCQNCGRTLSVRGDSLTRKKNPQRSCGCIISKGEMEIKRLFDTYGVEYRQQVTFDGLVGLGNNKLRFDFGVYENDKLSYLIEFQGIQHYYNAFGIDPAKYRHYRELDQAKKDFCNKNSIKLVEIKYNDEITIENILHFKTKGVVSEDFVQYKKPSMFITNTLCSDFKCDRESGAKCCINSNLVKSKTKYIPYKVLIENYLNNPISKAIVFGGLECFDEFNQLITFIRVFREKSQDDIVIYTGYYKEEIDDKIDILKRYGNIIIKYGRFIPGQEKHYDEVLGIELASSNQYAEVIS